MAFCLHKLVNVACFMKYLLLISITNIDCPNRCFASCNKIFRMLKQILFSGYICNYFFFSFDNIDFNFLFHTMRYSLLCFGKTSSNLVVLLEDIFQNFYIWNHLIAMSHLAGQRCRGLSTIYARKCVNRIPICNCLL